ncbi:hypothetical protein MYCTH_2296469 [Thermothelomyces thermophilus ATCC 42464]|uniref:LIM zinc-binding domain-containing protein n=1 Tax=Thermothelomyces thermophilus (strain ATCC 42464 / BCRC 31852 / DSM 1799) TaxID=573729 RepID=G2Q1V6_THET4|nr:uncharacterized protein MYCTH_2296469 [Thermothelomyces thermophilus ATCC 42464]AEO54188.1 hypothetical protein MYCTH_2296469 [Thermothelomyces thermophilus ATCC 42464]
MFARGSAKERSSPRKVTPPSPSYMSSEQFAAYLADLRNNRIARPAGARPPPASKRDASGLTTSGDRSSVAGPSSSVSSLPQISSHQRAQSDAGSIPPAASRPSLPPSISSHSPIARGKDNYRDRPVQPLKPSEVVPSATYIERGQRWMEKEEASSLRRAMEAMDLKDRSRRGKGGDDESDEERRIYNAALDEAAELVWRHQNPGKLPEPGAPYRYRPHLRKNSYAHARAASLGRYGADVAPTDLARDPLSRSVSGSSTEADSPEPASGRASFASSRQPPNTEPGSNAGQDAAAPAGSAKSLGDISSNGPRPLPGRRSRSRQKGSMSGDCQEPFSGDQIWEEPDKETSDPPRAPSSDDLANPLRPKPKEPLNRLQFPRRGADGLKMAASPPSSPEKVVSKYEIHRNPPSQSRNPHYTINPPAPAQAAQREDVPRKHGMEIRSEEIIQATSMKLKDRSPKLPTPSAVSDSPGRPIVSFDKNWKPQEEATDGKSEKSTTGRGSPNHSGCLVPGGVRQQQSQRQEQTIPAISARGGSAASAAATSTSPTRRSQPPPPSIQVEGPPVPAIAVSDPSSPSPPAIVVEPEGAGSGGPNIPVIVAPDDAPADTAGSSRRPLPTPQSGAPRVRQAARPRAPWPPVSRPAGSRATARCHECGDVIEGRFVSLAGMSERFHPQCFTCYACGTSLEALEISPEPDNHRAARLDRIARRAAGEILPEEPGQTMAEDGDERLRFYCHLDWHELFAPRCKHCKTPIMGEHVVALGAHWHFGHFFCAECGEPFEKGMTHIEKDGYAWCVSCQTKRTERRAPKCRKCRTAVIGQYVRALGGEWHDECFRCATCNGSFDDGQIFPMEGRGAPGETVVLCTKCMEKELKA